MGIDVRGLDKLQRKLGKVAATKTLRPVMERSLFLAQNMLAKYPPAIPGSQYIRGYGFEGGRATSEKLGQKWTTARHNITKSTGKLQGRVGTNVSYAPWVQDRKFQAAVHKNRWQTIQDITEGNLFNRRVTEFFQDAIDIVLRG